MTKKVLKIAFWKYWSPNLTPQRFFRRVPHVLKRYRMVPSTDPDFVFCAGPVPPGHYTRIFYNNENIRPNTRDSEWSFGTDYEDYINHQRYMRHPNYVRNGAGVDLIKKKVDVRKILSKKTKFCAFVHSHNVPIRNQFFHVLSRYKKVDSPGSCCQNMSPIGKHSTAWESRYKAESFFAEKLEFFRPYKFAIIFEHSSHPGYVSEKIYHAMKAGCIPIYWGNPLIHRDFDPKSFISAYHIKHKSLKGLFEYLVERVIQIDKDDDIYARYLKQPWYYGNKPNKYVDPLRLLARLDEVFGV